MIPSTAGRPSMVLGLLLLLVFVGEAASGPAFDHLRHEERVLLHSRTIDPRTAMNLLLDSAVEEEEALSSLVERATILLGTS